MGLTAKWSSGSGVAWLVLVSACSSPESKGSLEVGSGGVSETLGAASCDSTSAGASGFGAGYAGGSGGALNCGGVSNGGAGGSTGFASAGVGGPVGGAGAANAGSAGAAVTGGAGGAAGASGRGGNGTGGSLGKCDLLLLQASAALAGAQVCYTSSGKPFCTGYTTNECGCKVPVNDAEGLETQTYVKARDLFSASCSAACSAPCVEPKGQTCQLILGLVVGSCVPL